ncbi:MAG: DNA repair protein RecO [Candidatus Yonathbacteria bacterium]|nr:DNA repair protein RecO [Candidatus Yonathbacteria bacterium]
MSHHIYHTRGIILSSRPAGESNRFYKIFTEELGLVGATAQSVREGKSKLRYTLQDLSMVSVDFVRGKEVWRIVSAGAWRPLDLVKEDSIRIKLLASFCSLLSRFLHGEWRNKELFEEIVAVSDFLETWEINSELVLSFETLVSLRVLAHLGYLDPKGYEKFLSPIPYSGEILQEFEKIRPMVLSQINEALSASHL